MENNMGLDLVTSSFSVAKNVFEKKEIFFSDSSPGQF